MIYLRQAILNLILTSVGKSFFTLIEISVHLELSKVNPENCTFIIFEKAFTEFTLANWDKMTKINIVVLKKGT